MYSSSYCFNFKAALPVCFPPHGKKFAFPADHHKQQQQQRGNAISRSLILCCQPIDSLSSDDNDNTNNVNTTSKDTSSHDKSTTSSSLLRSLAVQVRKELKDALTPLKHKEGKKGDWKDLVLMSLSFAVYVYMSQKLVSAYCAYMSSFHTPASSSW